MSSLHDNIDSNSDHDTYRWIIQTLEAQIEELESRIEALEKAQLLNPPM